MRAARAASPSRSAAVQRYKRSVPRVLIARCHGDVHPCREAHKVAYSLSAVLVVAHQLTGTVKLWKGRSPFSLAPVAHDRLGPTLLARWSTAGYLITLPAPRAWISPAGDLGQWDGLSALMTEPALRLLLSELSAPECWTRPRAGLGVLD